MQDEVRRYLDDIVDLPCATWLRLLVEQICALEIPLEATVGAFGVRFTSRGQPLCELSVFGELFIARVGSEQAMDFRVRNRDMAMEVLDRLLHELHAAGTPVGG